jgi:hypothetical protein
MSANNSRTIAQARTARLQQTFKNRQAVPRIEPNVQQAGSYPFPDLTLPWQTILMNLLNEVNAASLPQPLTTDVCVFGDPQPFGGTGANTVIPFGTSAPQIFGTGTVMVYYSRIDVSQVVAAAQPATEATMMSQALASINTEYALNLQASDIIDGPITNGAGTLNIAPSSRIYTGNIALTFSSSNPTPSPVPAPTPTPTPEPSASFSYAVNDNNSLEVAFSDTSNDPTSAVVSWNWNFGDSNFASTQNPTHTYAAAGTYTVSLSITDAAENTYNTSQDVTVVAGGDDEQDATPDNAPSPSPAPTPASPPAN